MARRVVGIDVFCGVGGLTYGLQRAGITIAAGIDLDPACEYPFKHNNGTRFIKVDVTDLKIKELAALYPKKAVRLLAGCAPCQPFSPYRHGSNTWRDAKWGLLREFERLVRGLKPELITMENVPELATRSVFRRFVRTLKKFKYEVASRSVHCARFGLPQHRRRLVLLASRIGSIRVPSGRVPPEHFRTVRSAIGSLKRVEAGKADPKDRLHKARALNGTNLRRIRAARPGGTWLDWPKELRSPCHRRIAGKSFRNVYGRMVWDEPGPTVTTLSFNFGTGRFGHPEQDRAITLREAAILQGFRRDYEFVKQSDDVTFANVGRLIGNAVPPPLAERIGRELVRVARRARAKRPERSGRR